MSREQGNGLLPDEAVVSTVGDGVYQLDEDGRFVAINDAVVEATGYDREALLGAHVSLVVDEDDVARLEAEIAELLKDDPDGVRATELPIRTADGETLAYELRFSVVREGDDFAGTVGVARDVSTKERRDAELKAQRDELERLRRINAVIRSIDRAVVRADTVERIERAVCDRIAADPYRFALVVRFDPQYEEFQPRTWAGIDEEYVDLLQRANFDVSDGPGATAARTRTVQVIQDIEEGEYDWSEPASECGFRSLAAIPLVHEETVYGVLGVYSDQPYAFDQPERKVLGELGEMVGYAIFAVKARRALLAEQVVQLTFRIVDEEYVFTALSARESCTVRFEDAVFHPDGALLLYVSVRGAPPEKVVEFCRNFASVSHLRVVSERDEECLLEVRYDEPMVLTTLTHHGGVLRSAVAEDGVADVHVDLPDEGNVREIVDALANAFDSSELVSRQTVERPVETRTQFRDALDRRLTDRQRAVLMAAYHGGYFDWPRGSTGEELAESLDISAPTLHKHLRLAEKKFLSTVFE
ncbi:bacterio-opsin activator domain-containing protein [Haladaptatus salinisoli]|uniref:bacterio-opsin activator domain-containing protein n=1 Tax=Haladaptatus salinisoli TaxID=2884876 RepID=UPI001D0B85EE|nr:bacterio-opsin activator domain-containing protein [Haladaptatus salinisoli]